MVQEEGWGKKRGIEMRQPLNEHHHHDTFRTNVGWAILHVFQCRSVENLPPTL